MSIPVKYMYKNDQPSLVNHSIALPQKLLKCFLVAGIKDGDVNIYLQLEAVFPTEEYSL